MASLTVATSKSKRCRVCDVRIKPGHPDNPYHDLCPKCVAWSVQRTSKARKGKGGAR